MKERIGKVLPLPDRLPREHKALGLIPDMSPTATTTAGEVEVGGSGNRGPCHLYSKSEASPGYILYKLLNMKAPYKNL